MNSRFDRWAPPIAGIVFVVLMVVGSIFVADVPRADAPEREIADYLGAGDTHTRNILGAYLWAFGALAFLCFLAGLRSDLRRAEGGTGILTTTAFGAGVAFASVWMVSAAIFASVANAVALRGAPISNPDLVRVLPPMARLLLLVGAGFAGLLLLLAASGVILRTGVFPRWLAWLGIVAAVALLFAIVYGNILPFWTWVLIASVVMLVRREESETPADRRHVGQRA